MINAKELARQLDRFLKSPTCQDARVVVKLPQGEFHSPDGQFEILYISLFDNNIIHKGTIPFSKESPTKNFRYAMTLTFQPFNRKLSPFDKTSIQIKRILGWRIKELSKRYKVSERTIYRTLKL